MKAISLSTNVLELAATDYPVLSLYADSAIGRDLMPLFIPDIPIGWRSEVCVAARVERLGKNISEKFAHRYIDAIGLVNVLVPDSETFAASGAAAILDSAVTTGRWLLVDLWDLKEVNASVNGAHATYTAEQLQIPRLLSRVSRVATVKTGDILILRHTAVPVPLVTNTYIRGSIDGTPCLEIKVK